MYQKLIAGALSVAANMLRDRKQRKIENERYERQLKDSRDNWHMQNVYNSPSAQMARLKAAGLNPNMIYQNGGAMTGAGEIGSTDFQTTPYSDYSSMVDRMLQTDSVQSQIRLNEQYARKAKAEALGTEAENEILDKTTLRGLATLEGYQNLSLEQMQYYGDILGMSPDEVSSQSLRWFNYAGQLRSLMSSNKVSDQTKENLTKTFDILSNENDIAIQNATRAYLAKLLDAINFNTEAQKNGVTYRFHPRNQQGDLLDFNETSLNYALDYFKKVYKEMKWQSSDGKHILDQIHQTLDHIPGLTSLRRNPLLESTEEEFGDYGTLKTKKSFYHYSKHK